MPALWRCLCLFLLVAVASAAIPVERVAVELPGWPSGGEPAKVAVLSDLHVAATDGRKLDGMVEQVRALKPAVVALLGDYRYDIDPAHGMAPEAIARHLAPLAQGSRVLYILGNHDQGDWADKLEHAFAKAGFTAANGKVLRQRFGKGRAADFAGVSFIYNGSKSSVERLLPRKSTGAPLIVLAHSPYLFLKYEFPLANLVLAGHTHGGQVCWPGGKPMQPNGKLTPEMQRGGMHTMPTGKPLYITRGIGESRTPMRLNCPREITLLELTGGSRK